MIKRLIFAGAVAVLAIGCADSNKQADNLPTPASGDAPAAMVAYGDQNSTLPAPTASATENSGKSYTVVSGDSLWKIARNNSTTVEKLKAANNLTTEMIHPGQVLVIP
jgi:LysM repeat protein